jgi:hypothetical protein
VKRSTPRAAAALAYALASGCGASAGAPADAAGADTGGDGGEIDGRDAGLPATCPETIAACVQALDAIQAGCAVDGLTCVEQQEPSGGYNDCYPNGVRVYWDQTASDTGTITVVGPDGRVCYTVEHSINGDDLVTDTVKNPTGQRVIAKIYRSSWDHTIYACSSGEADIPDNEQPCGRPINVIPLTTCTSGICQRL